MPGLLYICGQQYERRQRKGLVTFCWIQRQGLILFVEARRQRKKEGTHAGRLSLGGFQPSRKRTLVSR